MIFVLSKAKNQNPVSKSSIRIQCPKRPKCPKFNVQCPNPMSEVRPRTRNQIQCPMSESNVQIQCPRRPYPTKTKTKMLKKITLWKTRSTPNPYPGSYPWKTNAVPLKLSNSSLKTDPVPLLKNQSNSSVENRSNSSIEKPIQYLSWSESLWMKDNQDPHPAVWFFTAGRRWS